MIRPSLCLFLAAMGHARAESFESGPAGAFKSYESSLGTWTAEAGHAQIQGGKAADGSRSLRLAGEGERSVVLALPQAAKESRLSFQVERWTKRDPFDLVVEARASGGWTQLHHSDATFEVGKFQPVQVTIPAGTKEIRFRSSAPADAGVLIDSVTLQRPGPVSVSLVETVQPVCPAFIRAPFNPILGFRIVVDGSEGTLPLEGLEVSLEGTSRLQDIAKVQVFTGSSDPAKADGKVIAESAKVGAKMSFATKHELSGGEHWFWISPELKETASIDGRIDAGVVRVKVGGKILEPKVVSPEGTQRIGFAVRLPGDDKSKAYRIPGLVKTKKGTLLAAYDIRYGHAGDLPANVDVGISRSTDGGQSWEPMKVAMDMGDDPKFGHDGVGDPCIFVDDITGRVWIAALWSHGNRAWNGSGPGMKPEETGQLVLVYSDNDGKSWSRPENITPQVKDPAWRLLFNGPGTGVTMKDGTLVMPAQYRAADGKPFSTLITSKDRGKSWSIGTGIKSDTTEAQVVELADGSLMLNCRDNRGGFRTVGVSKDLGKTWELHPTDRKGLREPVCMASLLRWKDSKLGDVLFFSNPDSTSGRKMMTVKLSKDQGMTWDEKDARLYDWRSCMGYSCLAPVDDTHVGVIYEGNASMLFLRVPLSEWAK